MTLEEAIQHLEESLNDKEWSCEACKMEHKQLLEWLQELKRAREYVREDIENKKKELEAKQRVLRMQLAFNQF